MWEEGRGAERKERVAAMGDWSWWAWRQGWNLTDGATYGNI